MTNAELNLDLFERGVAPKHTILIPTAGPGKKPYLSDGVGGNCHLWSPATDIAQAIEMASREELNLLWSLRNELPIHRPSCIYPGEYSARVCYDEPKDAVDVHDFAPARALSLAVLAALVLLSAEDLAREAITLKTALGAERYTEVLGDREAE